MLRRRLARDYETLPASSEAMIHIASIDNLTKRITDETTPAWRGTYLEIKGNSATSNALADAHRAASSHRPSGLPTVRCPRHGHRSNATSHE